MVVEILAAAVIELKGNKHGNQSYGCALENACIHRIKSIERYASKLINKLAMSLKLPT